MVLKATLKSVKVCKKRFLFNFNSMVKCEIKEIESSARPSYAVVTPRNSSDYCANRITSDK